MAILPGSKKLGEERRRIRREEVEGSGAVIGQYRFRRLFEYELDIAARKNGLTLEEALLLAALSQMRECSGTRRLGEVAGVGQPKLFLNMQKLEKKKLITQETTIRLTAEGEKVCRDFAQVEADLRAVCTAGFSEEECNRFDDLKERMEANMIRFMVKEVWEEEQDEVTVHTSLKRSSYEA